MQHEWIIRVLEDLQGYARMHGLTKLAEHLEQSRLLAMTEIASVEAQQPAPPRPPSSASNGTEDDVPSP